MEQRSLRVMDTNKTFFSKLTNSITKMLIPTRVGINNLMINIKRNALLKVYEEYKKSENVNENKKESIQQRYEESYALYLEAIDKYIMDSLYKKVKNNTATAFEREHLSKYYLVVSLKEKNYLEYKYRKQEYLLKIDYESAINIKRQAVLDRYKSFYVEKMDSINKGLLKNYSIGLVDNTHQQEMVYNQIFTTLENYVSEVLPIKMNSITDIELLEDYDKYESGIIGKLDKSDIIFKKVNLLNISRHIFTHSFPLTAIENCYIQLIKEARTMILENKNEIKREKALKTFYKLIDEYNVKVLSTKVFWATPQERNEYKKFWDKYKSLKDSKSKGLLILKYDLKQLDPKKYKEIRKIYKEKLVKEGIMKQLINTPKTYNKTYLAKKEKV